MSKDRLSLHELDALIAELNSIRKQKMPHVLSQKETELLQKINADLPVDIKSRYALLNAKRAEESVSEAEYQELMELTNFIEYHDAKRLGYLIELAKLRNTTLEAVIQSLNIKPDLYVC